MPSHRRSRTTLLRNFSRRQLIAGGAAIVIVVGAIVGVVVASGGGSPAARGGGGKTGSTLPAPGTTQPKLASDRCPLTDLPAPGGTVPQRVPIAVKIGNEPGPEAGGLGAARPQSGLNEADVVYDTPVEGGLMRYIAVFQCTNASQIGPVRSERWVDPRILAVFRHAILAHVGGIAPNLNYLNTLSYLQNADDDCVDEPASACVTAPFSQLSTRVPPDATYTSTQGLYAIFDKSVDKVAPAPIFRYSSSVPASAKTISAATINFSPATTTVTWQWSAADHAFLHLYDQTADVDQLNQTQVSAPNVFIQIVSYQIGPYEETSGIAGSGDVESNTLGSGKGYLLRDGKEIAVTWHRAALQDPTTFTDAAGQEVGLAPGRTWVEMILDTYAKQKGAITFTP